MDRGRDDKFYRHILPVMLSIGHIPPVLWGAVWEHPPNAFLLLSLVEKKKWDADWSVLWGSRLDHGQRESSQCGGQRKSSRLTALPIYSVVTTLQQDLQNQTLKFETRIT